ncbi:hypothetical protein O3W44_22615 [Pantoea sp. LMR881]|uniref:hypothetical protein n=1 Tax=Pantoea sp. LMR881 TaxID=3014336 RepID=UPI0022AFD989|nr:hypothetical protein [Pantoea sp. LMR881]MCZ4061214.1 hypothetical protein [Pantoea sp. LMR881]MCZ4061328.1 hypothetical protein [Pantoea sp. LMR881]
MEDSNFIAFTDLELEAFQKDAAEEFTEEELEERLGLKLFEVTVVNREFPNDIYDKEAIILARAQGQVPEFSFDVHADKLNPTRFIILPSSLLEDPMFRVPRGNPAQVQSDVDDVFLSRREVNDRDGWEDEDEDEN